MRRPQQERKGKNEILESEMHELIPSHPEGIARALCDELNKVSVTNNLRRAQKVNVKTVMRTLSLGYLCNNDPLQRECKDSLREIEFYFSALQAVPFDIRKSEEIKLQIQEWWRQVAVILSPDPKQNGKPVINVWNTFSNSSLQEGFDSARKAAGDCSDLFFDFRNPMIDALGQRFSLLRSRLQSEATRRGLKLVDQPSTKTVVPPKPASVSSDLRIQYQHPSEDREPAA